MTRGPASGSGQGEDPARGPAPDRTPPQDKTSADKPSAGGAGGGRGRGPGSRLARGFGKGGPLDGALPGAALIQKLDRACGPGRQCGGATLHLRVSLPCRRGAKHESRRSGEQYCNLAHRCPPSTRSASHVPSRLAENSVHRRSAKCK